MRYGLLFVVVLLLAGCATIRSHIFPDRGLEERQVIQLINYSQRIAAMTAEQRQREYDASIKTYAQDKNANSRIRLALVLAIPGASVQDTARAASLLEPITKPADAVGPLRSFARLLYAQLNERVNEQRHAGQMRNQIQALKLADRTMRKQLEELKELQRSILQRGRERQTLHQ